MLNSFISIKPFNNLSDEHSTGCIRPYFTFKLPLNCKYGTQFNIGRIKWFRLWLYHFSFLAIVHIWISWIWMWIFRLRMNVSLIQEHWLWDGHATIICLYHGYCDPWLNQTPEKSFHRKIIATLLVEDTVVKGTTWPKSNFTSKCNRVNRITFWKIANLGQYFFKSYLQDYIQNFQWKH